MLTTNTPKADNQCVKICTRDVTKTPIDDPNEWMWLCGKTDRSVGQLEQQPNALMLLLQYPVGLDREL